MVLFSHILEICQTVCLLLPYASDNNVDIIVDILLIHCRCHVVMKSKRPIQCRENVARMLFQHCFMLEVLFGNYTNVVG